MEALLKTWKTSRNIYSDFIDNYTPEQLNKVPSGFNNNLIWNIGHIIVAQQSLIYKGSGLPMYISDGMVELYQPGTRPTVPLSEGEIKELQSLLTSLIEKTEEDLSSEKFITYNERMTATGFHLASLKDAFEFNNYHEGIHLGYMMSLRKFV
ncbi:DinB family protein [Telluribacter sp. SYSU D00476]|uniref:DinB family protein n=1 Tax=Telluribacter sp. SYSU D00476 TaxID=2811430 RepID=UPI001FF3F8FA|nr:DinB family protein [Telluribacter sp. SYSU D00476]